MSDFDDDQSTGRSGGPSIGLIAAIAVVVLIVIGGALVLILGGGDDDPSAADPTDPASESTAPADPEVSRCGLKGHETQGSLPQPPVDAEWELVGNLAVPVSPEAGPGVVTDTGLRYCYSRTPEGALLSAINSAGSGEAESQVEFAAETTANVNPGYDIIIKEREALDPDASPAPSTFQFVGYRLTAYSDTEALVELVARSTADSAAQGDTSLGVLTLEMVWFEGDWRVRPRPDGSLAPVQRVPDLAGFVAWSGV